MRVDFLCHVQCGNRPRDAPWETRSKFTCVTWPLRVSHWLHSPLGITWALILIVGKKYRPHESMIGLNAKLRTNLIQKLKRIDRYPNSVFKLIDFVHHIWCEATLTYELPNRFNKVSTLAKRQLTESYWSYLCWQRRLIH